MEGIFSFIIPILVFIFWIMNMSKQREEQQKQQQARRPKTVQQQQNHQSQTAQRSTYQTQTQDQERWKQEAEEMMARSGQEIGRIGEDPYTKQKRDQMEDLKDKLKQARKMREQTQNDKVIKYQELEGKLDQKVNKSNPKVYEGTFSIKNNLTSKGIAQGIIMSEVLGPPRAYQKRRYGRFNR
ncbi:hypothetical protein [Gracilibacillus alcaliphilus]|uniref:hypothetical protein n=1 Tax=Gracilibacillus alcaliphilus TaxID=1401441 RepID=UPI00195C3ED4|nr:hypothetical protein [Gracilibacillus alcaliphilus]MBM7674985.1 mannitol-specific phosphotransferase system IIBC component [Gracilibacillus alcaliphilus]